MAMAANASTAHTMVMCTGMFILGTKRPAIGKLIAWPMQTSVM